MIDTAIPALGIDPSALAMLFYNTLRYGVDYSDSEASCYEERHRERVLHKLSRRANKLGYTLGPTSEARVS